MVNELDDSANEAPSSEVKQVASDCLSPEISWVTPVGATASSPPVPSHMFTGTVTYLAGRKPGGRTKATSLVLPLLVETAPLKWTIPETSATAGLAEPG